MLPPQAYQRSQDLFVGAQEIRNNRDKLQRHVYELESDIQRLLHQLEAANKKASAAVDAKKEAVRSAETANRNHKDAMGRIQELKAAATAWGVQKTAMQQVRNGTTGRGLKIVNVSRFTVCANKTWRVMENSPDAGLTHIGQHTCIRSATAKPCADTLALAAPAGD
jgi:negative regulator of replication initiation